MPTSRRVCVSVLLALAAVGCGAGREAGGGRVVSAANLADAAPVDLAGWPQMVGVDADTLFVESDGRAATLDVRDGTWPELPGLPDLAGLRFVSLDRTVLGVGLDCASPCPEDALAPIVVVALDLDQPDQWRKTPLDLKPCYHFSVAAVGRSGNEVVVLVNHDLVALSADGGARRLGTPPKGAWIYCTAPGERLQAVTESDSAGESDEPLWLLAPRVGSGGNAVVAEASVSGTASDWRNIPGSDTSLLPIPVEAADGQVAGVVMSHVCAPDGVVLGTEHETLLWEGSSWRIVPSAPDSPFSLVDCVVLANGGLAATQYGGSVTLFDGESWRTIWKSGRDESLPPILELAAVGDKLVVLDQPRREGETPHLEVVTPR